MTHHPSPDVFRELAKTHNLAPVYRVLLSDTLTPVTAYRRLGEEDWSFLFESVIGGERVGRYSFLGCRPFLTFEARGEEILLRRQGKLERKRSKDPLQTLSDELANYRAPHVDRLPRFVGGAVGFAGYDSVRYSERLPNPPADDRELPDLCFGFYDQMVVFDHITKVVLVVALAHIQPGKEIENYADAARRVDEMVARLSKPSDGLETVDIDSTGAVTIPFTSNFSKEAFEAAVRRCKEFILAGDFFQIVISQRLETRTKATPMDIYRTLRVVNPSPFMVLYQAGPVSLVASSPEIMVRVENGVLTTRPLAGTRPRGATDAEDDRLAHELLADPKERAEHIMLVDLGRNDVGRVAEFDSVTLTDLMTVERYSHVMHITSNVSGRLREGLQALDALRACLPAGTVSGAPKVRAMEVIDEIEPHRRGPYGGAIGYIDFTGNMDTCIALRTLVMIGDRAYVQAGAGIVHDSDPTSEYQETLNKAKGLLKAIELAERHIATKR